MFKGGTSYVDFFSLLKICNNTDTNITQQEEIWEKCSYRWPQRVIAYEDDDTIKLEEWKKKKETRDKERRSILKNASEAHLVVGVLITTVTFAVCITMPGGFVGSGEGSSSSHPGSALLRKNAAFIAFIITDTISMVLSSSAVFIHLLMPFLFNKNYDEEFQTYFTEERRDSLLYMAFRFILWAMIAMVLAFVTGSYVVLVPSLGLAIANCIIGLTFFPVLFFVFRKFIRYPPWKSSFFYLEKKIGIKYM
jgi:hypothetical protein